MKWWARPASAPGGTGRFERGGERPGVRGGADERAVAPERRRQRARREAGEQRRALERRRLDLLEAAQGVDRAGAIERRERLGDRRRGAPVGAGRERRRHRRERAPGGQQIVLHDQHRLALRPAGQPPGRVLVERRPGDFAEDGARLGLEPASEEAELRGLEMERTAADEGDERHGAATVPARGARRKPHRCRV